MIKKMKYRISVIKQLFPITEGVRKFLFFSFLFGLATTMLSFVTPLFYRVFIDDVITGGKVQMLYLVVGGYLSVFAMNVLIGYLNIFVLWRFDNALILRIKRLVFDAYWSMPVSDYETIQIGDMKMRIEDESRQMLDFTKKQSIDLFLLYIRFIISLVLALAIDYRLSLFAFISIPVTIAIDNALSKREKVLNTGNRENEQNMTSWLKGSLQGWKEIKAHNAQESQEKKFEVYLLYYASYYEKWINYWTARVLVIPKIKNDFFMKFALYLIGGLLIIRDQLLIGDLLVFAIYYEMLSSSINSISNCDAEVQSNRIYIDKILELLQNHRKTEIEKIEKKQISSIEFRDVCYAYPEMHGNIIDHMSFTINRGERVAINGRSGCGKTTVLKLIMGIIHPDSGQVLISGEEMNDVLFDNINKHIGCVMQESKLFNTSIKDNLLFGNSSANDEDLYNACKKARIMDFISELPDGFDTIIGEKGIKLSGGQRQRLVLARLFLRNVDVYIFDEATSNIDPQNENMIYETIYEIAQDRTVIVVSHRESTISLCDRVINIEGNVRLSITAEP